MDESTQDLLILLGSIAVIGPVTGLLVWSFLRSTIHKVAPVGLLLAGFCLEIFLVRAPSMQLGLQIYPNDVISLLLLMAAIVGFAYRPLPINDGPFLLWLAFGVTIIVSFVIGLNEFGRYAGTEVRPFFYMWVAGLYCCGNDFSEAEIKRIARWCVWVAYALIGIATYYFVGVELGVIDRQAVFQEPESGVFRPVGSHAALFIASVGLVQTMAWLRGSGTRFAGLHAALFIIFTVVIQHRSVWVAAAVGLLAVFILERRHLPRRFALLLGFTLSLTFVIAVAGAAGYLDDLALRLLESTLSMADSGGTFAARVDGWMRLLEGWFGASPTAWIFGFPFGKGYTRMYNGVIIEFAPHNFFLDLMLRVGIVGLILFLVPTVMAVMHGLRAKTNSEFEYLYLRGLGVVLLSAMVYFIAYPSFQIIGAATGVALAHLIRYRRPGGRLTRPGSLVVPQPRSAREREMGWQGRR